MSSGMVPPFVETANADGASWLRFAELCETLAGTRSKLRKRAAMAEYLRPLNPRTAGMAAQFLTGEVFAESDERKVQVGGQLVVRGLEAVTQASEERFHAAYRRYGDLGAAAEELMLAAHRPSGNLSVEEIAARLDSLAVTRGMAGKSAQIVEVLGSLSPLEAKYFIKLLLGDMRMGVKQSLVEEAIAVAAQEELSAVRRAETMLGNIPAVVELAWTHRLDTARFRMFHSLGFMLATPAASTEDAVSRFGEASVQIEDKYDGMRAQIHCGDPAQPGRVRIFSRTREDVTGSFPELAEWFAGAESPAILDGEILAWDFERDRALPFTALQQRLGRKRVTAAMRAETQVLYMAFDLLLVDGRLLLEAPLQERRDGSSSVGERNAAFGQGGAARNGWSCAAGAICN